MQLNKRTICKDGVSLSVQANQYAYCSPREDGDLHYQKEVGYITDINGKPVTPPETWKQYADGDFPSDVYGYVPVELIEAFITEHGGVA